MLYMNDLIIEYVRRLMYGQWFFIYFLLELPYPILCLVVKFDEQPHIRVLWAAFQDCQEDLVGFMGVFESDWQEYLVFSSIDGRAILARVLVPKVCWGLAFKDSVLIEIEIPAVHQLITGFV